MKRGEVWQPRPGKSMPWYAWQFAGQSWRKRSTGKREKRAAAQVAARWLEEGAAVRAGTSPVHAHAGTPIAAHIDEFMRSVRLTPTVTSDRHVRETQRLLERIVVAAKWTTLTEISVDGALAAIEALATRSAKGWSHARRNGARAAVKAFSRWAWHGGRLERDPLTRMKRWPMEGYERTPRRAMTTQELERLLTATVAGGTIAGLEAHARAMLYILAVATGLRRGELASLTVQSFRLDAEPATVRVGARDTKSGREAVQPILDVVDGQRTWLRWGLAAVRQAGVIWSLPESCAGMLRQDLACAGIEWKDADGRRLDFHALRGTMATWLALGGASMAVAQKLMRHSKPETTSRHYMHLDRGDLARAGGAAVCSLRGKNSASSSGAIPANGGGSAGADRPSCVPAAASETDLPSVFSDAARQVSNHSTGGSSNG